MPKQDQLEQIAEILDCDVSDFFAPTFRAAVTNVTNHVVNGTMGDVIANANANVVDPMGILSEEERELVNMYRRLSVVDRARLMVMLDDMASPKE